MPEWLLPLLFFLASLLYSSVGHGGASAYLAVMGLVGFVPAEMRPVALTLNIAVSLVAFILFARAGHFRWQLFWPLALASIPAAFIGGQLDAPDWIFKLILSAALLFGAWRLTFDHQTHRPPPRQPHLHSMLGMGAALGLLSGLIGIGGGIFLTPLLIFLRWTSAPCAAAISAAFIFVNSLSGLSGFLLNGGSVPDLTGLLLPGVLLGGWIGARWGSQRAGSRGLRRALALVLIIAAAKFVV
jgi:uncharacterized protein